MDVADVDYADETLLVRFEPCVAFSADPLGGSEICEHCGWLDADHQTPDEPVVTVPAAVLSRAA